MEVMLWNMLFYGSLQTLNCWEMPAVNERRTLGLKATILKTISIVNNVVNTTFR